MSRRTIRAGLAGGLAAALTLLGVAAHADPNGPTDPGTPLTPPPGGTLYAGVGADAFAELSNNVVAQYNATSPTDLLESFDAVNPVTGTSTTPADNITTKAGCSDLPRPNGANAGVTALLNDPVHNDGTYCIDWVRSSRARGTAAGEASLIFYAQSRDAVSYATIGNAYAPTTPLTTAQLKDIFECTDTDWSQVGGQPGAIHVYVPPTTAATYTFFLQAIGSSVQNVTTGCGNTTILQQQNDGRTLNGDPQGIAPYAVTKWAAQENQAPGIADNRGGAQVGLVNTTTPATVDTTFNNVHYEVLNPAFATGASASFGRIFYNVVRNNAPQDLKDVFKAGGYLCQHQNAFLIPFGNTPLGDDQNQSRFCGQLG